MWRPLASRWPLRRLTIPHVCDQGHEVDLQRSAVRYAREVRQMLRCPIEGCDGYLWPVTAPTPDQETRVRAVLAEYATASGPRAPLSLIKTPSKQDAAPGEGGAAVHNDDGWKEPTDMHLLTIEATPRGRQIAAALALAHLLEKDLPEAEWRLDGAGRIHGHVGRPGLDENGRAAIEAYATFLGVEARRSQGRNEHSTWIRLEATGSYRDAPINIWTHVSIRPVSPYSSFGGAR